MVEVLFGLDMPSHTVLMCLTLNPFDVMNAQSIQTQPKSVTTDRNVTLVGTMLFLSASLFCLRFRPNEIVRFISVFVNFVMLHRRLGVNGDLMRLHS